jgi:hypothetical protein
MYKNLLIIIISLILSLNILNADSDNPDYNIDYEKGGTGNEPSEDYKVKDFYGTWVVVKVRFMLPCDFSERTYKVVEKLGAKFVIKPNIYQGYSPFSASPDYYVSEKNIFYSTEIVNLGDYLYGNNAKYVAGADEFYNSLVILSKKTMENDVDFMPNIGNNGLLFIKDKNTLIYTEFTDYTEGVILVPLILFMLTREEEAKKLDKYSIYVPTVEIENIPKFDDLEEELGINYPNKDCPAEYDEYANKLIKQGKYNVIRDNTMARDFVDIE